MMTERSSGSHEEFDRNQKYWESLERTSAKESRAYDKSVLTLSSAALGASLILLKDISGDTPTATWTLAVSWVALGLSIAFTLLSMLLAVSAHDQEMEKLGKVESESDAGKRNWWSFLVTRANWLSYVFFLVGIASLCLFAFLNLRSQTNGVGGLMNRSGTTEPRQQSRVVLGDKDSIEKGRKPPPPPKPSTPPPKK